MTIEIKIPSPGESISEVELASWFVENGDMVERDQEVGEIESEKATLPLIADKGGKIELLAEVGDMLKVGDVACKIDTSAEGTKKEDFPDEKEPDSSKDKQEKPAGVPEKKGDQEQEISDGMQEKAGK